jgi:membrane-bound serine protease (ClpP class)
MNTQKQAALLYCFFLLMLSIPLNAEQQVKIPADAHIAILSINGAIGPATTDYLVRSMSRAQALGAAAVIITMDTPGGLDAATRDIIKAILSSPIPVMTFIHPAGARAASAGTYILYASHIAAMTPSTTLGAATPVSIGVPTLPSRPATPISTTSDEEGDKEVSDERAYDEYTPQTTMERKVVNDAVAFIRGLAKRHHRNEEWAEKAVRQAATLTANEALQKKVIDIVAVDINDLLVQVNRREVQMETDTQILISEGLTVVNYAPDWRNQLLAVITDPQIAYILLMIGIYGLVLEGYNPGALVPGVIGGICLITAFYALQVLPVNYAGLALIILGVLLIVAETMAPSLGILGIGGVISTTLGSVLLIDSDVPGMQISYKLIGSFAIISSIVVLAILIVVGRSLRMKRIPINQAMIGQIGIVESFTQGEGLIHIAGERWQVTSHHTLQAGQQVRVILEDGLMLNVDPIDVEPIDINP